jgi:hypothetical protein
VAQTAPHLCRSALQPRDRSVNRVLVPALVVLVVLLWLVLVIGLWNSAGCSTATPC